MEIRKDKRGYRRVKTERSTALEQGFLMESLDGRIAARVPVGPWEREGEDTIEKEIGE